MGFVLKMTIHYLYIICRFLLINGADYVFKCIAKKTSIHDLRLLYCNSRAWYFNIIQIIHNGNNTFSILLSHIILFRHPPFCLLIGDVYLHHNLDSCRTLLFTIVTTIGLPKKTFLRFFLQKGPNYA
jgi:hypothetical protein